MMKRSIFLILLALVFAFNCGDPNNESETSNVTITSVARYPVANAGYNKTFVMGQEMRLNGQMSHDPQEKIVLE